MSMWWSLHLRREAASVPLARRFLLGTMESAGVDPDISYDLSVALSEACANAVEHGGAHRVPDDVGEIWDAWGEPSGTACGQYQVTAYLNGERCRIEVADSGPGFPARRTLRDAAHQQHQAQQYDPHQQDPYRHEPWQFQPQPAGQQTGHPPLAAESGRGLCLIEQLADHVHFGNRPGRGGAVVSFDKVLKWREGALLMVS
ncbi:ATP-binding protein [Streptomyces brevispora]|uniref:ATP-binding protein n=1 Tax=Streptomyces brevispora TaxID=887462 RepID=A0A561UYL8_9ACTN|nr:ATP-binding protein [Streptomyces brevispora]TWG04453.1 serine/threonine-protein kinase RsbW [Streptomyces brevispora]WSC14498.1 ATP-binding protein [Streptomyces brevispora]